MTLSRDYDEIWVLDFEFDAQSGERPEPICMVAHEIVSGRRLRLWQDELSTCPFETGANVLFVAYFFSAEIGCFQVLGWPVPERILDLYVEYRMLQNGNSRAGNLGLLDAAATFDIHAMSGANKTHMRDLILSGGPWRKEERQNILDYCEEDVRITSRLLEKLWPIVAKTSDILGQALFRGRYMAGVAQMEFTGVPLDAELLDRLTRNWSAIKKRLITEIDQYFGVYDGTRFVHDKFEAYLQEHGHVWPRLDTGKLKLDRETFRVMVRSYPGLGPLYELHLLKSQMNEISITCGRDGRNRVLLSPFRSKTGRNQPSNSKFIFGASAWVRGLIKPEEGYGLAYCDFSSQEIAIAASLSGDAKLWEAYSSGDPYMAFAIQAGLAPRGATKATHKEVRNRCKAIVLGVGYGMGAAAMAQQAGIHIIEAQELLLKHRNTYSTFWAWAENNQNHAIMGDPLATPLGWRIQLRGPADINERSLLNWPMQSSGSDMMRLAVCNLVEAGVEVCCPVHDALLVRFPLDQEERTVNLTKEMMADASETIMGEDYRCRVDADIIRFPDRYMDERGEKMWGIVMKLLEEAEDDLV